MSNRRDFIKSVLIGGTAALVAPALLSRSAGAELLWPESFSLAGEGWIQVPEILKRIRPPVFPRRDFSVTRFGAVGDARTDCTDAFRRAIAACNKAGGGRVVVPAGKFLTGPIHLRSNVNLHLDSAATIMFSQDPTKYLPLVFSRWEGMELMNYSPFIYAFGQKNIAITGNGTLDGQSNAGAWWPWNGRASPSLDAPGASATAPVDEASVVRFISFRSPPIDVLGAALRAPTRRCLPGRARGGA